MSRLHICYYDLEGDCMVEIQYLGQNGFKIRIDGKVLCFDLYLSNSVYEITGTGIRNYKSPVKLEKLNDIDYFFITHDHLDHLDPYTIKEIDCLSRKIRYICPIPHIDLLKEMGIDLNKIVSAKAYTTLNLDGFEVIPVPEKHEEYRIINGEHGNLGYIIRGNEFQFYHSGDVIADKKLADDLKKFGRMDIMFVPINGHDWFRNNNDIMGNMNYREALDLCNYVGTDLVVPMHYDLFSNNTENPAYFIDYLYKRYFGQRFKMFMPGETLHIERNNKNASDL